MIFKCWKIQLFQICITLLPVLILLFSAPVHAKEKDSDYIFGVHFESRSGMSSSQFYSMATTFTKVVEKDTGYRIRVEKFPSRTEVTKAFIENKVDSTILFTADIYDVLLNGGDIHPLLTYTINHDGNKNALCLWQKKDVAVEAADEVRGSGLILVDHDPYIIIQLRDYLASAGIDQPIWKTFENFTIINSSNSAFFALTAGKSDFYWDSRDYIHFLKLLAPTVKSGISDDLCSEQIYGRAILFMNKNTVPDELISLADDFSLQIVGDTKGFIKKYPEMIAAFKYARMTGLELVRGSLDDFQYDLELYKHAKENGWLSEAEFISRKLDAAPIGEAIQIIPDLEYCKESCGDSGADCVLSCID